MKKNFITGFVSGALIFGILGAFAASYTAVENPFPVKLNNKNVDIEGYNINDSTYFKLRDIADTVGGFDVDFKDNTILLSTESDRDTDELLTVATNALFPPFEFVSENGIVDNFDGIDIAIAKRIADEMGKELKIYDMEFDAIIPCISAGRFDMSIAGMPITDDRKKVVDFSEPYYSFDHVILTTPENTSVKSAADLYSMKTGVILNSVADDILTYDLLLSENNVKKYKNLSDIIDGLKTGSIDAAVVDSYTGKALAAKNDLIVIEDSSAFETEEYAIAVNKGNSELLDNINSIIKKLKESGEIAELAEKYNTMEIEY